MTVDLGRRKTRAAAKGQKPFLQLAPGHLFAWIVIGDGSSKAGDSPSATAAPQQLLDGDEVKAPLDFGLSHGVPQRA